MMDSLVSTMIDMEEALAQFHDIDLYRASIGLFKAMNYPVIATDVAVNSSIEYFFCFAAENYPNFNDNEMVSLNFIDSISYLFFINSENPELEDIKSVICNGGRRIDKIIFLAVEITGFKSSRSLNAFDLTIILSKAFSSPVFVLFKHEDEFMFTARSIILDKQKEKVKVYLSDWYNYNILSTNDLIKLSALCLEYQDDTNLLSMYYDMITSIARKYYINLESYDFLKYGLTFDELKYKFVFNKEGYQSFLDKTNDLKQRRNYYKNLYGDDYIDAEIEIDISFEDEELMLEDLESLSLTETDFETNEFYDNDSSAKSNREESLENDDFIDQIDTSLFKDPIKLLKYLNEFNS